MQMRSTEMSPALAKVLKTENHLWKWRSCETSLPTAGVLISRKPVSLERVVLVMTALLLTSA